jgi:hypothetical protein
MRDPAGPVWRGSRKRVCLPICQHLVTLSACLSGMTGPAQSRDFPYPFQCCQAAKTLTAVGQVFLGAFRARFHLRCDRNCLRDGSARFARQATDLVIPSRPVGRDLPRISVRTLIPWPRRSFYDGWCRRALRRRRRRPELTAANIADERATTAHRAKLAYVYVRQSSLNQVKQQRKHGAAVPARRSRHRSGWPHERAQVGAEIASFSLSPAYAPAEQLTAKRASARRFPRFRRVWGRM